MSDVIQILIDDLKSQCCFHTNGVCQTRACLIRGGYKVGEPVSYSLATCLPKEQAAAIAQLTESNRQLREELEWTKLEMAKRSVRWEDEMVQSKDYKDRLKTALAAAKEALRLGGDYIFTSEAEHVAGKAPHIDDLKTAFDSALARIAECEKGT